MVVALVALVALAGEGATVWLVATVVACFVVVELVLALGVFNCKACIRSRKAWDVSCLRFKTRWCRTEAVKTSCFRTNEGTFISDNRRRRRRRRRREWRPVLLEARRCRRQVSTKSSHSCRVRGFVVFRWVVLMIGLVAVVVAAVVTAAAAGGGVVVLGGTGALADACCGFFCSCSRGFFCSCCCSC